MSAVAEPKRHPYKVDTEPVPLDVFAHYGGKPGYWYRIPSWRAHFDYDPLRDQDIRLHRSIASGAVWTITEATTGFQIFADMAHEFYIGDEGALLAEFCAGLMLRITAEKMAEVIARAKVTLATKPPNPFALEVTVGRMEESNGRVTFSATLTHKGSGIFDGYQFACSASKGRVDYEADKLRKLLDPTLPEPDILTYDTDLPSEAGATEKG